MATRRLKGSCLCGKVRYTVADAFTYALICHCAQCRRATGSAFKPFGGIASEKLRVTRGRVKRFGSASTHNAHCKSCGSLLYSIVNKGKTAHVTYGTLMDPPTRTPGAHIYVSSKAAWYDILDRLPQYTELPPN